MRVALVAASLVLVGGTTLACGGSPEDASKDDFCEAFEAAPQGEEPSQDEIDEWVEKVEDTGTPDDIDEDERNGFEVIVDALKDVDVDDFKDSESLEDVVSDDDDRKDAEKFFGYYLETCSGLGGVEGSDEESGSEEPSDDVSDLPTGLPSDFPTDVPTDPDELQSYLDDLQSQYLTESAG